MTTTVHKNLTGSDLHESKGVDTALAGEVYVTDGTGSGIWTPASSVITNTAFSTGDLKPTHKVSADPSWILWSDGTIGDGSSGASIRANADTAALFALYWTNYSNTLCPVSSGRGVSAVADYAAHKTITLPVGAGRVFGLAGAGSGLTSRTVGSSVGGEILTLIRSDLPNASITVTVTDPGHVHSIALWNSSGVGGGAAISASSNINVITSTTTASATTGITAAFNMNGNVTQTTPSLMQPTTFINMMIKL